jgi:hypothetical protein
MLDTGLQEGSKTARQDDSALVPGGWRLRRTLDAGSRTAVVRVFSQNIYYIYKFVVGLRPGPRPRWPRAHIRPCPLGKTVAPLGLITYVIFCNRTYTYARATARRLTFSESHRTPRKPRVRPRAVRFCALPLPATAPASSKQTNGGVLGEDAHRPVDPVRYAPAPAPRGRGARLDLWRRVRSDRLRRARGVAVVRAPCLLDLMMVDCSFDRSEAPAPSSYSIGCSTIRIRVRHPRPPARCP